MKKYKGHLITHTHWDREWYQPVEIYRFRLIEIFERLKDIIASDESYHSFFLDGQTVPIDDYLEARKGDKKIIAEYIKKGRLRIGPFYVLLDEQLVSGESYVRNLMIGINSVKKYGGSARIGYMPDNFGHISQTPQILSGFGIDNIVMWRGYDADENTPNEALWKGSDGTEIKAVLLLRGYSSFAGAIPGNRESFQRAFDSLDELKQRSRSDVLLFMHGIDHSFPHPEINAIIKIINEYDNEVETEHSDFETYLKAISWEKVNYNLEGELINTPHLDGTFSSRIHLKQMNRKCENELAIYAEPLSAIAWMSGHSYPAEDLLRAWKYLIRCHPHDSITGCHSDRVTEDIQNRLARSYEMAVYLKERGFDNLSGERFDYQNPAESKIISVFNPMPVERNEIIRAEIFVSPELDLIRNIYVKQNNNVYQANIVSHDEVCWPLRSDYMIPKRILHKRLKIEFGPVKLASFSITDFEYEVQSNLELSDNLMDAVTAASCDYSNKKQCIYKGGNVLENKFVIVEIQADATVNVTEKTTGKKYKRLNSIEAETDAGNLYNFAPVLKRVIYYFSPQSIVLDEDFDTSASMKLTGFLKVPAGISNEMKPLEEKVFCPMDIIISLKKDDPVIYFKTSLKNNARNICVRTVFESNIENAVNHVHTPFDVIQRKPLSDEYMNVGERMIANGLSRYCAQYFTSVSNEKYGLTLVNKGLPEYTFHDKGTLTLTLLRSSNIIWGATEKNFPLKEYPAETGFELGHHEKEYGLLLHNESILDSALLSHAFAYNMPPVSKVFSKKTENPFKMRLQPESLILSAFKRSEDGDGVILRFYNILNKSQVAEITLSQKLRKAFRCFMNETIFKTVPVKNNKLKINVKAKEIVTLKLLVEL